MTGEIRADRPSNEQIVRTDLIAHSAANAFAGLLGVPIPDPAAGEGVPILWHWLYMLERPPQSSLGRDGHPTTGIPAPPGPGRRRMWAGGRVVQTEELRFDELATRRSYVQGEREKQGRQGRLTFVAVAHEISQGGRVVIKEEQDIVYRDEITPVLSDAAAGTAQPQAPPAPRVEDADEWAIDIDPVLLFRFSALTYNAHRIHYDRDYAREVEGYAGLVVHGPLQAIMMVEMNRRRRHIVGPTAFEYRLIAPLLESQGLVASISAGDGQAATTITDASGRLTAQGTITHA